VHPDPEHVCAQLPETTVHESEQSSVHICSQLMPVVHACVQPPGPPQSTSHAIAAVHITSQPPPAQSTLQLPVVHDTSQPPPAHATSHVAEVHSTEQSPPAQSIAQVEPAAHSIVQLPPAHE
jgi:hypothetical protein